MKQFTEWLENDAEDCGILSPPLEPQEAIKFLIDYLLGEDWYCVGPIHQTQVNTEAVFEILMKYSKRFRKEWKKYKDWKCKND